MAEELDKKLVLDPQDPLPESKWLFRRILMFGFATLFVAAIVWTTILIGKIAFNQPDASVEAIKQLTKIVLALGFINGLLMVLYLVAPSGEQVAKMLAMAAAMRDGVSFNGYDRGGYGLRSFRDEPCDTGSEDLSSAMKKDDGA